MNTALKAEGTRYPQKNRIESYRNIFLSLYRGLQMRRLIAYGKEVHRNA